jgi:hypothetical protein
MRRLLLLAAALTLAVAQPARAAQADWSVAELENEVMCTVCHQLLSQSQSAFADGVRKQIQEKHDLGWSKQRTLDWLVQQYVGDPGSGAAGGGGHRRSAGRYVVAGTAPTTAAGRARRRGNGRAHRRRPRA